MTQHNDIRGYAAVPSWMLRDESISAPAVLVFASLASRAGFESIHPGQDLIAREARCSERRVRDALKELESRGLIERVERRFANGRRASDGYVLHSGIRPSSSAGEQPAADAGSSHQPADSDATNRQNRASTPPIEITTSEITTKGDFASLDDDFARWYAHYPRRVARAAARKAYEAAAKKIGPDYARVLGAALGPFIRQMQAEGRDVSKIAHPSTWLNQERWEDEHAGVARPMTPAERMAQEFASVSPDRGRDAFQLEA